MHTDSLPCLPLHRRQHIDQIMSSHGKQIMQAVTLILEAEHSIEVKEQVSLQKLFIHNSWCEDAALQSGVNILQV